MPRVTFTQNLQRHVACPPCEVAGTTVQESLEAAFRLYPKARSYVLDEQGSLRFHMAVFVNGEPITDRKAQGDAVAPAAEIYVVQALSGG